MITMLQKIRTAWNRGMKFPHSKEWEDKRISAIRESAKLKRGVPTGRKMSQKTKDALKSWKKLNPEKVKEQSIKNLSRSSSSSVSGENSPNWRGGLTKGNQLWKNRHRKEFTNHRNSVLERDEGRCIECGLETGLQVHHIVPVSTGRQFSFLRMNGVTLCEKCHKSTDSYGGGTRPQEEIGSTSFIIKTIPHKYQDYDTCGNWAFGRDGGILIFVSKMSDWRYEACVAIHELVEVLICKHAGVTQESVDEFDIGYEKQRKKSITLDVSEPGDSRFAPYRTQHCIATGVERIVAAMLGVNWSDYSTEINSL